MLNDKIINDLFEQLVAHRKTLQFSLTQHAKLGSTQASMGILTLIAEARIEIDRLKGELRQRGQPVDDHPNDFDPNDLEVQRLRAETRANKIRLLCHSHADFIADRLSSFVGRADELAEVRQRIADTQPDGGYVTITGQAGQGKSSIIAKLVHDANAATVPHHFIPFTPRPDHQVGLLRDIMAQLILKHDLPDTYVAAESRPALRDNFAVLVRMLSEADIREVIYIDGLDQLQEDMGGQRDLSFLPTNPPPGIVFVLGTRPNDTLKPLELLKPYNEYQLPNLNRADFDLILQHRGASLPATLADRFYTSMQENALYLDLVAREIHAVGAERVEAIIDRVASNPNNLFSLTFDRLKLQRQPWRELIKPILGVLLATQSALALRAIRALIDQDDETVREGLQRLGGLIARDSDGRYALYHLKLRDYLRYDAAQPTKDYIFAPDEEETYHQKFIAWCEGGKGGLTAIWRDLPTDAAENERRIYAREHYITHLAAANNWDQLWSVIDAGDYGHAKLRHDPSTRDYVQDLDRARQAVLAAADDLAEPVAVTLPRLWRYSLLRGSLASQVDNYPDTLFTVLTHVGREQEAIGLAEVLSDPTHKATILCHIGVALNQRKANSGDTVIGRAVAVARAIDSPWVRAEALFAVSEAQAEAGLWEAATATARMIIDALPLAGAIYRVAEIQSKAGLYGAAAALYTEVTTIVRTIENAATRAEVLSAVAQAQAAAGLLEAAELLCDEATATARAIENAYTRAEALSAVAEAQAAAGLWEPALATARAIENASTRIRALSAVAEAQAKANLWEPALVTARAIEDVATRAEVLSAVAQAQAAAGLLEAAELLCDEATATARAIENAYTRAEALSAVAEAQAAAGLWEPALATARAIENASTRAQALRAVAQAQAAAGLLEAAALLCDEAAATARAIENGSTRARVLSAVAEAQAAANLWEPALATARAIENASTRAQALSTVAEAQAAAGLWEPALAIARAIEDDDTRAEALSAVSLSLEHAAQAVQLRVLVQSSWHQATTYDEIWKLLSLASSFVIADPALLAALLAGADWVAEFLQPPA